MIATRSASGSWFEPDSEHSARPLDALTFAAVAYLALPILIFCAGWLRPMYAIAACALLLVAIGAALRLRDLRWRLPYRAGTLLLIAATGFAWAAFGGAGHLFYANDDWLVRDAVLMDLVYGQWPPSYGQQGGEALILRTALAYFLPAAALGSLLGAVYADAILYLWTGLGTALFLIMLPLPRRSAIRLVLALAGIVLFSGMDVVGFALNSGDLPVPPRHLEWWSPPLQYSSLTTQLFWVPNHALPAWIATALFYRHWRAPEFWPLAVLIAALLPLWTPFAAPGIAPFVAWLAVDRLRRGLSLRLPIALLLPVLLLLALEGRFLTLSFPEVLASTALGMSFDPANHIPKYAVFALLEFGLLGAGLIAILRHSRDLCAVSMGVLAALPLISFGPVNDVVMRASIPSLAMLAILSIRALDTPATDTGIRGARTLVAVALALGAVTPIYEFWRALSEPRWAPSMERTVPEAVSGMAPHYVGRLDRADLKMIFRPPYLIPPRRSR